MTRKTKKTRYPYPKWRVYWSALLTALSVILAFLLLNDAFQLAIYFVSLSAMTLVIYFLRTRFSFLPEAEDSDETPRGRAPWRTLILYFLILVAIVFIPLALARFLDPYVWFILIISFASGISAAEVLFYLHCR